MEKFTYFLEQKRIRRFKLRRCAFAAIFLCAASSVFAQGYPETSYKLSDDKTVLESWKGDETDIDMNSDANLKGVNEIADYAFDGNTNVKSIVIGENVKTIGAGAFQDCSGLFSVSLGSRVSHIGTECFSGLSSLQQFSVYAVEPPSLGSYVFNLTPVDKCKLLVPEESIDKYKEAEQWKDFMTTTTSIASVSEGQMPLIRVSPGMLNIDNMNDGSAVSVYTLAGQKVYSAASDSGSMSVALQSGMYVVCINDVASKVLIP